MLKAYLDTCAVSRLVDERGDPCERQALVDLLSLHRQGATELVRSDHVEDEIEKIPARYLQPYAKMLSNFWSLPTVGVGGMSRMGSCGYGITNPDRMSFKRLEETLKDQKDRWHVFTAYSHKIKYLLTLDNEVLSARELIGVQLMRPSRFLELLRAPASSLSPET